MLSLRLFLVTAILAVGFLAGCAREEKPPKYSTIHEAAEKGDLEDVKNHLRRGVAVNAQGPYGVTPLFQAASSGHIKVAEFLIKKGADVNAEVDLGRERMTPLEMAAMAGFKDMVELLIKKGADIKKYGADAINYAVEGIEKSKELDKEEVPPYINLAHLRQLWTKNNRC